MSRLVDPTLCPDCRARLDSTATCTACGLEVTGPLASELWQRMIAADRVVEQLRARSGTAPAAADAPVPAGVTVGTGTVPPMPPLPRPTGARTRSTRLPAASVPVVLLSLGALCLLVAAVVFVAVAWDALGLTGRTLVLLGVTSLLALVAVVLTRRDLRGAAETLWLVVAGMLVVDLLGARSSGLLGLDALDWRGAGLLVGTALFALGLLVGAWALGEPVGRLYGAEAVAVLGALVACSTNVWLADDRAVACAVTVPLLAAGSVVLRRALPLAAYGVGGLAVVTWVALLLVGGDRALETSTPAEWWSDLRGWPLLAAAALAAVVVHLPQVPRQARPVAAGLALLPLVVLATAPRTPGADTREAVVSSCVLLALGLAAALAPRAWALGAAVLAAVGVLGLGLELTLGPWDTISVLGAEGSDGIDATLTTLDDGAAAWTSVLLAASVAATLVLLLRRVRERDRSLATSCVRAVAPAVVALGGLDLVLQLEPPLWVGALAGALACAVAGTAAWWVRGSTVAGWVGSATTAYLAVVTVLISSTHDLLLAITLSVLALALLVVHGVRERSGSAVSAAVPGGLGALVVGAALLGWASWFDAPDDATTIALAGYAALVGVLASPVTRRATSRVTFEGSALLIGAAALVSTTDPRTSAMALTIVGSAICLVAVVHRDRDLASWLGAGVLGVATLVRVDAGVQAPELYTLPAAALLLAAGAWRLLDDEDANSFRVLGSGLTLGLVPSLLLALDEPVSTRGALIGAAGVLVLAIGLWQRLAAPFVIGAVTTGLLALRHLEPYAEAVPRWISLGAVGLALLVVGVTWEARRQNLETAGRYLAALR